jgi:hypothetical protein
LSKKRILILGTSHSVGICTGMPADRLPLGTRWHDYFKTDFDCEVVNLSLGGCTSHQQFLALYYYFCDHKDRFDLILIEGRTIDTRISIPKRIETNAWNSADYYSHWLEESHIWKDDYPIHRGSLTYFKKHKLKYNEWYVDYVHSFQHLIDSIAVNLSICKLAEQYSDAVFFFTITTEFFVDDKNYNEYNKISIDMMNQYLLDSTSYFNFKPLDKFKNDANIKCECEHYNIEGSKILYNEIANILSQKKIL